MKRGECRIISERLAQTIKHFITSTLTSLYTSLGFSIIIAILVTYLYLFAFKNNEGGKGIKQAFITGIRILWEDQTAKHLFWLSLYTALILFKTLLNRDLWLNPLSKFFEGWWIWDTDKNGNTVMSVDCFGNMAMLMPMVALGIWTFPAWFRKKGYIKGSFLVAGGTSLLIETLQLVFRVGTFQFSDLVYNTAGGVLVGVIRGLHKDHKDAWEKDTSGR